MSRRELVVVGPTYYSVGDENAFFTWLQSIPCIEGVGGRGRDLHIRLKRLPGKNDLRELIALLYRYKMDMRPLAILKTARNAKWFAEDTVAYWHAPIFGKPRPAARKRGRP